MGLPWPQLTKAQLNKLDAITQYNPEAKVVGYDSNSNEGMEPWVLLAGGEAAMRLDRNGRLV